MNLIGKILIDRTTGERLSEKHRDDLKFRWDKQTTDQFEKQKAKGEVYTPNWVIKEMVKDVNRNELYLEPCSGLAPFINNRFDQMTGKINPIEDRWGVFDVAIKEMTNDLIKSLKNYPYNIKEEDIVKWFENLESLMKKLYAFEYDKEVLFLARDCMMDSIEEYFIYYFEKDKSEDEDSIIDGFSYHLGILEDIISWNFFVMDIFTRCIPNTDIKVKIRDWEYKEDDPRGIIYYDDMYPKEVKQTKKKKKNESKGTETVD